jgi:TRAP-type C4-dicarboxylate transport system substrate-binding protein
MLPSKHCPSHNSPDRNEPASTSRRGVLRIAAASALASLLATKINAQDTVKRIRFAHPAPPAHGWHIWAERFKKAIEEKTGGKVQVQIFPNAQMGNERDTAQAVRLGSIEMGAIGVGLMNWVPEMSITDAPFLWKSRAQCWNAISGPFGDELRKRSLDKGFVLSGWTDLGFRSMTNNKHPINAVKDMQNLKMRVPNSKAYIAMMQATGASTVAAVRGQVQQVLRGAEIYFQDRPQPHDGLHGHQPEVLRRPDAGRETTVPGRMHRRQ